MLAAIAVAHGSALPVLDACPPFLWPSQKLLPKWIRHGDSRDGEGQQRRPSGSDIEQRC